MAKRTTKKAPKRTTKPRNASKSPPRGRKNEPKRDTNPLTDEQLAHMWVLREEGRSLRDIADEVGCHPRTVSREFEKDPARHAALVTVQAENRAAKWKQVENRSLAILLRLVEELERSLWTPTGRAKKLTGAKRDELMGRLEAVRKAIGPVRMTADSSTKMTQLLSGRATEIVGGAGAGGVGLDASSMTDDEAISLALEHGLEDDLPKALQEKIQLRRARGEIPPKASGG